jgi:hypothetical protein
MTASTSLLTMSFIPLVMLSASKLFISTISCSMVRPATPPASLISWIARPEPRSICSASVAALTVGYAEPITIGSLVSAAV